MTGADELRAAATKLRTLAQAATPSPWCFYGDDLWLGTATALKAYDDSAEEAPWPFPESHPAHLFHGDAVRPEDAEFIAAMQPVVAIALADWLDDNATYPAPGIRSAYRALILARAINSSPT